MSARWCCRYRAVGAVRPSADSKSLRGSCRGRPSLSQRRRLRSRAVGGQAVLAASSATDEAAATAPDGYVRTLTRRPAGGTAAKPRQPAHGGTGSATVRFVRPPGYVSSGREQDLPFCLYFPAIDGQGLTASPQFQRLCAAFDLRAMRLDAADRTAFPDLVNLSLVSHLRAVCRHLTNILPFPLRGPRVATDFGQRAGIPFRRSRGIPGYPAGLSHRGVLGGASGPWHSAGMRSCPACGASQPGDSRRGHHPVTPAASGCSGSRPGWTHARGNPALAAAGRRAIARKAIQVGRPLVGPVGWSHKPPARSVGGSKCSAFSSQRNCSRAPPSNPGLATQGAQMAGRTAMRDARTVC